MKLSPQLGGPQAAGTKCPRSVLQSLLETSQVLLDLSQAVVKLQLKSLSRVVRRAASFGLVLF